MKRIAVMQPYLFPYIGYWQLLNAVDEFVLLDDVQYIQRGWINRNRVLVDGRDHLFSFSVCKDAQQTKINQRFFSPDFSAERARFLRMLQCAYAKAPFFQPALSVIERSLDFSTRNVAACVGDSLKILADYLHIATPFVYASAIAGDKSLKAQDYILALTKSLHGDVYINLSGGIALYDKTVFGEHGIQLLFLKALPHEYKQFSHEFIPFLSIVDVMMFNSPETIKMMLGRYELT